MKKLLTVCLIMTICQLWASDEKICLMKGNVHSDNHKYFIQLIHNILSKNI